MDEKATETALVPAQEGLQVPLRGAVSLWASATTSESEHRADLLRDKQRIVPRFLRSVDAAVQGEGGREEVWPLPKGVKEATDHCLKLDRKRREIAHSVGEDAYLFQPHTNYRILDFDKPLSTRMVQKIVKRWADYSRIGDLSPHDLRRTAITKALDSGSPTGRCRR